MSRKVDMTSVFELLKKAESAIEAFSMIEKGDKVLIALSGGKDSVCLTDILSEISTKYGFTLGACHLNHMIRGEEALRDENFSRELCCKRGIEFFSKRVDVPKKARDEKKSVEEAARDARYEFFAEISEKHGFNKIATAHTLSDQCETVLFNVIRGKGLMSVSGIPAVRPLDSHSKGDVKLIRPIITLTTEDVIRYTEANSLSYVTDSTNSDTVYARNLIRHKLIPLMREINPSFEKSISELSREAKSCYELIKDECDSFFADNIDSGNYNLASAVKLASDEKRQSVLYEYLFRMLPKDTDAKLSRERFEAIRNFLLKIHEGNGDYAGKEIGIGNGITCAFEKDSFRFIKKEHKSSRFESSQLENPEEKEGGSDHNEEIRLLFGENDIYFSDCVITVEKCTDMSELENLNKKNMIMYVTALTVQKGIYVRKRRQGDKVLYGGMSHAVKKILSESEIPSYKRRSVPVLFDKEGIIWVPGGTVCDRCNPLRNTAEKEISSEALVKITYKSKQSF